MNEPKRIGKYEILREVGRGGFAVVYEARDTTLERTVALKVLHPQLAIDPVFIQRFRQEAQTAAGLRHRHIVTIHEVGEDAGQYYLAMEFISGRTLDNLLAEGPLPIEQAVSIVEQIGAALEAIHGRALVHRDVKPGNIMVDDEGQATLLDFGIVRAAEGTRLTTAMAVLGTPEYMAPEQADPTVATQIDWRADIYALGIVTYEMLAGQPPFTGESPTGVLYMHVHEPPPMISVLRTELPEGTDAVLTKVLAKRREERFQKSGEFASALREALLAERKIREQPSRRRLKPIPAWVWAIGGAAALLILFIGWAGPRFRSWFIGEPTAIPTATATEPPTATSSPVPTSLPTEIPTNTPSPEPTLAPTEEQTPTAGQVWIRPSDQSVMVYAPGGTFQMGSGTVQDESPIHSVTISGFWIDQTEVTNSIYALCVADGDCGSSAYEDDADYGRDDHPVVGVSWHDAANYCAWTGGRLPTEAEWEYAARGADGHIYPWGSGFSCEGGNFNDEYTGCNDGYDPAITAPVGQFPEGRSWCGALDMAGNVWEWVADRYGPYSSEPQIDPVGPREGDQRVLRGGSCFNTAQDVRSTRRYPYEPETRNNLVGFRCVR